MTMSQSPSKKHFTSHSKRLAWSLIQNTDGDCILIEAPEKNAYKHGAPLLQSWIGAYDEYSNRVDERVEREDQKAKLGR